MVHGGPFPATSDSRATSVGTTSIERFLRPVCYQDFPSDLLPEALTDSNPLNLWRRRDGEIARS
jgi:NADP-dependent aldehyde dehydrogenase